jgi:DNA invertase Pin-like site-specific DNA recombinase
MVRERTNAGLKAARARGNAGGRKSKLTTDQKREIVEMLAAGRTAADLARLFKVHRATIGRMAARIAVRSIPGQGVDL